MDQLKSKLRQGTYVYCVIAGVRRPSLDRVPAGLPGTGTLRTLDLERQRWVIVASAPLRLYSEAAINSHLSDLNWVARAAIAHERVVESFVGATAVLPMKLFTIFASDERTVEHFRKDRRHLTRLVRRVANHSEWGIRAVLDATYQPPAAKRAETSQLGGAAYLTRKKAQHHRASEVRLRARGVVETLYDRLAAKSRSAKRRAAGELPAVDGPLLLDAAFLVHRRRAAAFQSLVARERKRLAKEGYRLMLTGPWPAYTFVQD